MTREHRSIRKTAARRVATNGELGDIDRKLFGMIGKPPKYIGAILRRGREWVFGSKAILGVDNRTTCNLAQATHRINVASNDATGKAATVDKVDERQHVGLARRRAPHMNRNTTIGKAHDLTRLYNTIFVVDGIGLFVRAASHANNIVHRNNAHRAAHLFESKLQNARIEYMFAVVVGDRPELDIEPVLLDIANARLDVCNDRFVVGSCHTLSPLKLAFRRKKDMTR